MNTNNAIIITRSDLTSQGVTGYPTLGPLFTALTSMAQVWQPFIDWRNVVEDLVCSPSRMTMIR